MVREGGAREKSFYGFGLVWVTFCGLSVVYGFGTGLFSQAVPKPYMTDTLRELSENIKIHGNDEMMCMYVHAQAPNGTRNSRLG